MALSEKTITRLREESVDEGGRLYEDKEDVSPEDVTSFAEDDDPLTLVGDVDGDGDVDADDRPVGEVPEEGSEKV